MIPHRVLASAVSFATQVALALACGAQTMPGTAGETLSGKHIVLADATRGHPTVLVAGFSREGGNGTGPWVQAVRADKALAGAAVYQVAMLEGAPGFIRGTIKNGMRKGMSAADQDQFVVLVQDEKLWRQFFEVTTDKEPYAALIDAKGNVLWHGHGAAERMEPELKAAMR